MPPTPLGPGGDRSLLPPKPEGTTRGKGGRGAPQEFSQFLKLSRWAQNHPKKPQPKPHLPTGSGNRGGGGLDLGSPRALWGGHKPQPPFFRGRCEGGITPLSVRILGGWGAGLSPTCRPHPHGGIPRDEPPAPAVPWSGGRGGEGSGDAEPPVPPPEAPRGGHLERGVVQDVHLDVLRGAVGGPGHAAFPHHGSAGLGGILGWMGGWILGGEAHRGR